MNDKGVENLNEFELIAGRGDRFLNGSMIGLRIETATSRKFVRLLSWKFHWNSLNEMGNSQKITGTSRKPLTFFNIKTHVTLGLAMSFLESWIDVCNRLASNEDKFAVKNRSMADHLSAKYMHNPKVGFWLTIFRELLQSQIFLLLPKFEKRTLQVRPQCENLPEF